MIQPAQLEHAWLSHVHFDENADFERDNASDWTYIVHVDPLDNELTHADEGGEDFGDAVTWTMARLRARIEWSHREGKDAPTPFDLTIEVAGLFVWRQSAPDDRMANLWLEYNAMYLLWPYLRQHIATITASADVPTLTIYTMNVPERPLLDEDSTESAVPAQEQLTEPE